MYSSEQRPQHKQIGYSAIIAGSKLLLEVNDNITYKGEIESCRHYDMEELKTAFQNGEGQIATKTTSKMVIKFGLVKI